MYSAKTWTLSSLPKCVARFGINTSDRRKIGSFPEERKHGFLSRLPWNCQDRCGGCQHIETSGPEAAGTRGIRVYHSTLINTSEQLLSNFFKCYSSVTLLNAGSKGHYISR